MSQSQKELDWNAILARVPYPLEAFAFVREGLGYAVRRIHEDPEALRDDERHITGQQLCMGLRDFAIARYGLLAPTVLEHWHVRRTYDFGRIVFTMIDAGLMSKTQSDTIEDFQAVYDFDEAFSTEVILPQIAVV